MGDVKRRDVDGGWAWVALVAAFFILALQGSYGMAVGYFQVEFVETFGGSKGFIALIGALSISGQSLLGPVAGVLSGVLTPRVTVMVGGGVIAMSLFLSSFSNHLPALLALFGFCSALGTGLSYTPTVTVVSTYFERRRSIANGISLASPGLGLLVFPHLMRWLIDTHGWRYAMAIYACLMAQMCVLAALFFPHDPSQTPSCCRGQRPREARDPEEKLAPPLEDRRLARLKEDAQEDRVGSRTDIHVTEWGSVILSHSIIWTAPQVTTLTVPQRLRQLLTSRFMWVMCLNQFWLFAGFSIHTVLFATYSRRVGVAFKDLPTLYNVLGVAMIVSRLGGGFLFGCVPNHHLLKVFAALQMCLAALMGFLPLYGRSLIMLSVYMLLIGLTYGPTFLLLTPILIHYVGLEQLAVAFGVSMMCCGLAFIAAPSLAGLMTDLFDSYSVVYYIAGCMVCVAVLSLSLLLLIKDLEPHNPEIQLVISSHPSSEQVASEKVPLNGTVIQVADQKAALYNSVETTNKQLPFILPSQTEQPMA